MIFGIVTDENMGDKIMLTGPAFGILKMDVQEIRKDNISVDSVFKGDVFSMEVSEVIRPSTKLYKIVSA